jgi:phthiocerol/phenolphthiocerol synthesis type-I polyketide synthase E
MAQQPSPSTYADTAIAVIGVAARVPGAPDVQRFWNNLAAGVESITIGDAPRDHMAAAGVLEGIDLFDAAFFGIPVGEAEEMDPLHRIFLECAWSALESAGHAPRPGLRAGVYGGATYSTYLLANLLPAAEERGTRVVENIYGFVHDFLATRVAYKLGLTGPAMTIQTGCSTSLVAIHVACQALIAGECDLALAGGAGGIVPQGGAYRLVEGGVLSADGHTRAFDARSTGFVPGSGTGVVVLRRLADALADRDPIRAIVLGTAINNDGSAKAGFAAPSVTGQATAASLALAVAGVSPSDISYIEAHGTATQLGDLIEIAALKQVFAGVPRGSCGIGSVKTNIGHADAAAGVIGFIKTVLALEHRVLPPSLHFVEPNPRLGLEDSPFYVVSERRAWTGPTPRRAGVSAFGIGGTNAHVVLEEPPVIEGDPPRRMDELLVVSARTYPALERMTGELAALLGETELPLADIAHTLQVGRAQFAARRFVAGSDRRALAEALRANAGGPEPTVDPGTTSDEPDPVFAFPGGGVQRVNMAAELRGEPRFAAVFDDCAERARGLIGVDLRQVVFAGPAEFDAAARVLDGPLVSQVAIFACEWALAQQWLAWGVAPVALLGHSLGEYAAACVAGVFSLDDALRVVAERGRILERLPASAMVSVLAPPEQVEPLLDAELAICAINGPGTCAVAGELSAMDRLEIRLAGAGIEHRRLRYARAGHTPLLDPHLAGFERVVAGCALRAPSIPMVSTVTGAWLAPEQAADPAYWRRQFREPVRFSDAVSTLLVPGRRAVIEAGPGRTLSALVRQHPAAAGHAVITTLPPASGSAPPRRALEALGEAWAAGVTVDWERFRAGERRRRVALPTYSFDRERYWIEPVSERRPTAPLAVARPRTAATPRSTARATGREPAPPRNATEQALVACFQELFRSDAIGIHDGFFALGGDSLLAVRLVSVIARRLDVRVPLKLVIEAQTVAQLAERITAQAPSLGPAPATESSCVVRLSSGAGAPPLFLVHGGGGHAMFYRDLAQAIGTDRAMIGFQSQGIDGREPPHASVEDMASHYASLARALHPDGPYLLIGSSFGGMIAYEMARQLTAAGHAVPLCAQIDTPGPGYLPELLLDDPDLLAFFVPHEAITLPQLRGRSLDTQLELVLDEARRTGREPGFADVAGGRAMLRVWRNNVDAMHRYAAPAWPEGEIEFFAAAEPSGFLPPHLERAWIGRCAVRVDHAPGDHRTMLQSPHAAALGDKLRARLAAALAGADRSRVG